jgi:hypothetical protein
MEGFPVISRVLAAWLPKQRDNDLSPSFGLPEGVDYIFIPADNSASEERGVLALP